MYPKFPRKSTKVVFLPVYATLEVFTYRGIFREETVFSIQLWIARGGQVP
jgi:hypothetical protein